MGRQDIMAGPAGRVLPFRAAASPRVRGTSLGPDRVAALDHAPPELARWNAGPALERPGEMRVVRVSEVEGGDDLLHRATHVAGRCGTVPAEGDYRSRCIEAAEESMP
jgi:hypothetical protein